MSHRRAARALVLALVVHLVGIYLPSAPPVPDMPVIGPDKLVHVLLFGVPAVLAARAVPRPSLLWLALAVHAPLSEWLQGAVLPARSADWHDAVADLVGLGLGVLPASLARVRGGAPARVTGTATSRTARHRW